jgi:rhodanese-related sulfurtransferase
MSIAPQLSWKRVISEVLIIAVAGVVGALAFDKVAIWLSPTNHAATSVASSALIGTHVNLEGATFPESPLTVLLIASPDCTFCRQSAPFYKTLWAHSRKSGIPLYVAVPSKSTAAEYLRSSGLDKATLVTWKSVGLTVDGTPTLLMIDRTGIIRRSWVGMLKGNKETEVLDLIASPSHLAEATLGTVDYKVITEGELQARAEHVEPFTVIDIRERDQYQIGHRRGAVNIPDSELYIRSPFELKASDLQVVDCAGVKPTKCRKAAKALREGQFEVQVLTTTYAMGPLILSMRVKPDTGATRSR